MNDYIKRADAVRDIEELPFTMSMCLSVDECKGMKSAQKIIASIVAETTPAADVVERKKGRWKGFKADDRGWLRDDGRPVYVVCDQCGAVVLNSASWNFCPNCGADMREES